MSAGIYLNVAVSGLLTGLVYGLMALGLSVIFGVVRVVNFAHGEMMTIAMYLAVALFAAYKLDPLVMMVPVAGVLFALGYVMQRGLINPFINRPEHSQFMLLVAVALIMVNALLIIFGPDAQGVQTSYSFQSFLVGPLIIDANKVYAGAAAVAVAGGALRLFPLHAGRQGDPGLRRQLCRRARGRARCQAPLRLDLRPRRGLRRRGGVHDGAADRRDAAAGSGLHAAGLRHRHHRRASARCRARCSAAC